MEARRQQILQKKADDDRTREEKKARDDMEKRKREKEDMAEKKVPKQPGKKVRFMFASRRSYVY